MIPWDPNRYGALPKDWLDFCNAASASACIYLPANTTYHTNTNGGPPSEDQPFPVQTIDEDPLITDPNLCADDGGWWDGENSACQFTYPLSYHGDFKPTGALSTTASCDPPNTYVLDDKGAVKVSAPFNIVAQGPFASVCVVQVWISL
jgi:hypothetical protein